MKYIIVILTALLYAQASHTQTWTSYYNNQYSDFTVDAASDASGNLYITAQSEESDLHNDIITIKYNSAGVQQWAQRYQNTNPDFGVFPYGIECFGTGIYVSGYILNQDTTLTKQLLIKYNDAGVQQWVKVLTYDITQPVQIKTDNAGNLIAVFPRLNSTTVIKYDSLGNQLWTYSTSAFLLSFHDLNVDIGNNILLLGAAFDCIIEKVALSGSLTWRRTYNVTGNSDIGNAVCSDNSGSIIITGESYINFSTIRAFTVKYSSAGDTLWSVYHMTPDFRESGKGAACDSAGNIWAAYDSEDQGGAQSLGIIKYGPSGAFIWDSLYSVTGGGIIFNDIAVDKYGLVSVLCTQFSGLSDLLLLRSAAGGYPVEYYLSNTSSAYEFGAGLALNSSGDLFIAGTSDNGGNTDVVGVGFINTIGIQNTQTGIPQDYLLKQNYPNPFNPVTSIEFSIPKRAGTKLVIFDISGRETAVLVNENLAAGSYRFTFDAAHLSSGVYFYRLETGEFTQVKKMMLIK